MLSSTGIYRINTNRNEVSKFSKGFGVNPGLVYIIAAYKANDGQLIFGNAEWLLFLLSRKRSSPIQNRRK